ncbi:hypothetical protein WN944_022484 [Citrus x changshan-huyou]|uniref:Uncharacterized protein n=1 Tax=Citrus x changshan-huyou TaxID=2935761 RepID=A0AAP0N311_9ROSI
MDYKSVEQNTSQPFVFHSLKKIYIYYCNKLKDLTFLAFAPNRKSIGTDSCKPLEEIVSDVPEVRMGNLNPFAQLQYLRFFSLQNLKSIYRKPVPFPHLR